MRSIYSAEVEDLVGSTFLYSQGFSGDLFVNWSDESVRRPTNTVSIFGTRGKISANQHAYKIYLKDDDSHNGLQRGWNSRFITDLGDNVRFYVRGNEFTRQLDYFIDCIKNRSTENLSGFSEAFKTDTIMQQIVADANSVIPQANTMNFKNYKR
jgi:predicted dehydrogenase